MRPQKDIEVLSPGTEECARNQTASCVNNYAVTIGLLIATFWFACILET